MPSVPQTSSCPLLPKLKLAPLASGMGTCQRLRDVVRSATHSCWAVSSRSAAPNASLQLQLATVCRKARWVPSGLNCKSMAVKLSRSVPRTNQESWLLRSLALFTCSLIKRSSCFASGPPNLQVECCQCARHSAGPNHAGAVVKQHGTQHQSAKAPELPHLKGGDGMLAAVCGRTARLRGIDGVLAAFVTCLPT